jgi:hypothetical protein
LGAGVSQFKLLDTYTYKKSQSYESNPLFVYLANRYLYENRWAVGVAMEYFLKEGLTTGNNSNENFFIGFDSTYDIPHLKSLRLNVSLMNGTRFGSHQLLFGILGVHLKFN